MIATVLKGFDEDFCSVCGEVILKIRIWRNVPEFGSTQVLVGFVGECSCGQYWLAEPSETLPEEGAFGGLPIGNPKEIISSAWGFEC